MLFHLKIEEENFFLAVGWASFGVDDKIYI